MFLQDTLQHEVLGWRTVAQPCLTPTNFSKFVQFHRGAVRPGPAELLQLLRSFLSHHLKPEGRNEFHSLDDWIVQSTGPQEDILAVVSTGKQQLLDLFPYPDLLEGV
jgi:hypothetical protein